MSASTASTPQLGAHVSAAGGPTQAPARGAEIGCDCIQVFTRNQRTWKVKPVTDDEAARFRQARRDAGTGAVMSHASYLINPCSEDPDKRERSIAGLAAELERCHQLGIELLNFHPGAHRGQGLETGIERIADALDRICQNHPDKSDVRLVLENVAGQGSTIGSAFSELRAIIDRVAEPDRLAVCIDTAHAFAAGYALHTEDGWDAMWDEFDRVIGFDRLVGIHLNDSKAAFDSRKDRHDLIGRGEIGPAAFHRMVTDPRTVGVPMFLETPAGPEGWGDEIQWLRAAAEAPASDLPPLPEIEDAGVAL